MRRHALTDEPWARLATAIPKQQRWPTVAMELLDYAQGETLLGDAGYDADAFVAEVAVDELCW